MSLRLLVSLLLVSTFSFGQVSFSKQILPTGSDPDDVIVGDVNHDGIPDLISVDRSDNTVSVRLGNGDGTFRVRSAYGVGTAPVSGSTADFEKNGKVDLVTANSVSNNVSVLIGNGDGTFRTHHDIAVGKDPVAVVVADFNGDGKTDIVTADYNSNTISILPGHGDGTFGTRIVLPAGTQHPRLLVKGDFNGDGKLDLLYSDCCQGTDVEYDTLHVLLNQGNFKFTDVTSFNISVPLRITVARLNGDLKDDLAISYQGCHTPCEGVATYTSNGNGAFNSRGGFTIDDLAWGAPTNTIVTDLNGDGRVDLAVGVNCCGEGGFPNTQDAILVSLQKSDGSFGNPVTVYLGTGFRPSSLNFGDFNRDKKPDLVAAGVGNNTLITLKNTTSFACSVPTSAGVHICSPASGATVSSPVTISAAAKGTVAIARMELWIDGVKKLQVSGNTLKTTIALSAGSHRIVVQGVQTNGSVVKAVEYVTVK